MKCVNCKNLGKLKDEDGVPYDWCEKVCDNPDIHAERKCKHYVVASHADRLRAMSDEELAAWLCDVAGWLPTFEGRVHPILEWLRQEAIE